MYGLNKSGVVLMHQPCKCIGLVVLSIQCSLWAPMYHIVDAEQKA